ncbi:SRPBCC domain-containing protein [Nocardia abscessus]|uniref:SRPBCC domain-containing protein n=1 Tax=Nocardia abscessus TaxID=120957 RepID=UPI001E55F757
MHLATVTQQEVAHPRRLWHIDTQLMVAQWRSGVEFGKLEREIRINAAPEIVFEVVSRPEHIKMWWPDDASVEPVPGGAGELVWGDRAKVAPLTVVDVDPPRKFAFRWVAPDGQRPNPDNSLLVTFELEPSGDSTILRLTESGWREKGWEAAVLEEAFRDHERGWDMFLPRLQNYAPSVVAR